MTLVRFVLQRPLERHKRHALSEVSRDVPRLISRPTHREMVSNGWLNESIHQGIPYRARVWSGCGDRIDWTNRQVTDDRVVSGDAEGEARVTVTAENDFARGRLPGDSDKWTAYGQIVMLRDNSRDLENAVTRHGRLYAISQRSVGEGSRWRRCRAAAAADGIRETGNFIYGARAATY